MPTMATVLMDYFSPAAITDNNGDVLERYDFSAFGLRTLLAANFDPIAISSVDFTFAFQGQFEDPETGWLNYGYRYYLPNLGRFGCKDPIKEAGGNNLYMMANNSAVIQVDLLGLDKPGLDWSKGDPALKNVTRPRADNLDDPPPDLDNPVWSGSTGNNCYNYATCTPSRGRSNTAPGQFDNVGRRTGSLPSSGTGATCGDIKQGILDDYQGQASEAWKGKCEPGYYKIRTWVKKAGDDFHVMREANDGNWYHKPNKTESAQMVIDPKVHKGAGGENYIMCPTEICVPCNGVP